MNSDLELVRAVSGRFFKPKEDVDPIIKTSALHCLFKILVVGINILKVCLLIALNCTFNNTEKLLFFFLV